MSGGSEERQVTINVNLNLRICVEHVEQSGGARAANRQVERGARARQAANEESERRATPLRHLIGVLFRKRPRRQ